MKLKKPNQILAANFMFIYVTIGWMFNRFRETRIRHFEKPVLTLI